MIYLWLDAIRSDRVKIFDRARLNAEDIRVPFIPEHECEYPKHSFGCRHSEISSFSSSILHEDDLAAVVTSNNVHEFNSWAS